MSRHLVRTDEILPAVPRAARAPTAPPPRHPRPHRRDEARERWQLVVGAAMGIAVSIACAWFAWRWR